jgi:phospholipase C
MPGWRPLSSLARRAAFGAVIAVGVGAFAVLSTQAAAGAKVRSHSHLRHGARIRLAADGATATPIKHLVVIFQENVSFDHYFGTYPNATNPSGEPQFTPAPGTPTVNGLTGALLTDNPNSANPQRLDRSQAFTCDQNHGYTAEQSAFDHGAMDMFVQAVAGSSCPNKNIVMDYYDGNTVTGLWNYAQHFAMSDNSYSDTFGPSTPGALNVTAGNTFGAICGPPPPSGSTYNAVACTGTVGGATYAPGSTTPPTSVSQGSGTVYSDSDPFYDVCSHTEDGNAAANTIKMGGKNIGDLLDGAGITWGWFQGGFASPGYKPGDPSSDDLANVCTSFHTQTEFDGKAHKVFDYNVHHEPFQYYIQTANPQHLPPTSIGMIGHQDQANHQYDLKDFWAAADSGNLPQVSYLKAPAYQDGHAGYSDPLDEQTFLVDTINHLERLPSWKSTAVVIAYDDSDGWYDQQMGPTLTASQTSLDTLTGTQQCGTNGPPDGQQARCGVGMRQPLLVISPYSRANFVDNTVTTQSSVVRFIEDNWLGGQRIGGGSDDAIAGTLGNMLDFSQQGNRRLFLDPSTGEPADSGNGQGVGNGG